MSKYWPPLAAILALNGINAASLFPPPPKPKEPLPPLEPYRGPVATREAIARAKAQGRAAGGKRG